MQDRFRFRTWDKKNKKWLHFDFSTYLTYQDRIWDALTDGNKFYQCTGLKDKNGKLIYEGDVLQLESFIEDNVVHICFWNEEGAEFLYEPIIKGDKNAPLRGIEEFAQESEYILNEIPEVIGNIYENPELLETKEM